jgi:hypothetical protein
MIAVSKPSRTLRQTFSHDDDADGGGDGDNDDDDDADGKCSYLSQ